MIRELVEAIQEADIFKPATPDEAAARKAEWLKELFKTPPVKLFVEVNDQTHTSYDRIPGNFWYDDEEDAYIDENRDLVSLDELAEEYRDANYSTFVGVRVVTEDYLRGLQDEITKTLQERVTEQEEDPFVPASAEEYGARRAEADKVQKEEEARVEAIRVAALANGDYIDHYLKTSVRGVGCTVCDRTMPPGKKYLGISRGGGRYSVHFNVCKECLKHAAKRIK